MRLRHQIPLLLTLLFPAAALTQTPPAYTPPTPAEIHAAAVHSRMAARIRESRKAEAEYEATLDPRQFQA